MKEKSTDLIDVHEGESIILNSKFEKLEIYNDKKNGRLFVKLILMRYEKTRIFFEFEEVSKCIFNFDADYDLGYIEDYKILFIEDNLLYLSLDPDNKILNRPSDKDSFIIIAKKIKRSIDKTF